jgi:hypothetical protein
MDSNGWPQQEDHALREMAERLEKELTVTQHLLKIARLHQRTPWPGERAAAAEAFARVSRGTPWAGLTPDQFLRSAGQPKPEPEPVMQPAPEAQARPHHEKADGRRQDQHETVNERTKPRQQPASQKQVEAVNWRGRLVAVFVLAAITAGATMPHVPERNPPPAQTPTSGPQASAAPLDDIAPLLPKKVTVVAVGPEHQPEASHQTATPVAPEVTPPASPALTPERRAESIVYHLTAIENRGNLDDLSAYYSDTINYYGKPTAKSGVVADKTRFMRRWPNRKYTIRPESVTVACDITRCTADGMIDFDVSNAGKRSMGTASFTYHLLMRHKNSEPPALLVTAEDSTVVSRTVTEVGQLPAAAP